MIGVPTSTVSPSFDQQLGHRAGVRAGQLDQRLAGLHLDQDVVDLDLVADRNPPGDDVCLDQSLTRIGQPKCLQRHASPSAQYASERSTISSTRSRSGRYSSSTRLGGYGMSKPATRSTGASSE